MIRPALCLSPTPRSLRCRRLILAASACVALFVGGMGRPAGAQSVWEWTPYTVQLVVVVDGDAPLPETAERELAEALLERVELYVGGGWKTSLADAPRMLRSIVLRAETAIRAEDLPAKWLEADKVLLIGVSSRAGDFLVTARDFDVRTRTASPAVSRRAGHPLKLADAALAALLDAFAPLAQIETVEGKDVTLRLRAAALAPRDPRYAPVEAGKMFRCVVRFDDRDGNPRRIETVPWTVLQVATRDGAELACTLHTGIRSPLSVRRRGRVEQLALGVVAPRRSTVLAIRSRTAPHEPLASYGVFWYSPGEKPARSLGLTDRQGQIEIPYDDSIPLRIVLVRNGAQLLARLPIAVGHEPAVTAAIANDDARLSAAVRLASLQEELLDLVTQREILITRIRALLSQEKPLEARTVLQQLAALKSRDTFINELRQEQNLLQSDDPAVQKKIDRMFETTRKQVFEHLDPRDIDAVRTAVTEAIAGTSP